MAFFLVDHAAFYRARDAYKGKTYFDAVIPSDARCYLNTAANEGFAICSNRFVCSFFNAGPRRSRRQQIATIQEIYDLGGRHSACYDGPLLRYYTGLGAIEGRRKEFDHPLGWDKQDGTPDIVQIIWLSRPSVD